jgi:DNA-binding IclR family transcriptional regulator
MQTSLLDERMNVMSASDIVPAVSRAAAILDVVADAGGMSVSSSEISRQLALPKSSTTNICQALENVGMLTRRENGYTLGRKLVELGGRYLATIDPLREYYDLCRTLPSLSKESSRVAVLDGTDVLYVAKYEGYQPIRLTANIGDRFPASCTATGKALLALLNPSQVADRYRASPRLPMLTEKSCATLADLQRELELVRGNGYATDVEEATPGVTCFALALTGFRGDSSNLAVSATVLSQRLTPELGAALLQDLRTLADLLSNPMEIKS